MLRDEDSLGSLDLKSWGVLEVKLLEKRLRASDHSRGRENRFTVARIGAELKEVQRQCYENAVDGLNVAMTIMRFGKDARVVLYACVLLEAALAAEWCALLPEPRRRELKVLLLGVCATLPKEHPSCSSVFHGTTTCTSW